MKVQSSTFETTSGAMTVSAEEHDNVSTTIGGGTGAAAALAASVGTLRVKRQAAVLVRDSVLDSKGAMTVGAKASGSDALNVYQATAALVSGTAAVADAKVSGSIQTTVENSTLQGAGAKTVSAEDESTTNVTSMGIQATGIAAGAMLGFITDESSVATTVTGRKTATGTNYDTASGGALTVISDRNGRRNVEAVAGSGGGLNGVGAKAQVKDSGSSLTRASSLVFSNAALSALSVEGLNRPHLSTKSYGVVAGGISVGVVQTVAEATGQATVAVSNSTINVGEFSVFAGTGFSKGATAESSDLSTEDALTLVASSQGYGGSVVQVSVNSAEVRNSIATTAQVTDSQVTARSANVNSLGFAVYKARTDAGSGGVVSAGSNKATITNAGTSKTLWSNQASKLGSADISAYQLEMAYGYVSSAGGGLVDAGINAAQTNHSDTSSATVEIASAITTEKQQYGEESDQRRTSGDFAAGAATRHIVRLAADNTKGALAGGSGAEVNNSLSGSALVQVKDGVALSSEGTIDLAAGTLVDAGAAVEVQASALSDYGKTMSAFQQSGTYATNSSVYGAIAGSGIVLNNTQGRTGRVSIGKNALLSSAGSLTVTAQQINNINWRSRARSAGIMADVSAHLNNTLSEENDIAIGEGARLETTSDAATLTLSASAQDTIYTEAVGDLQGGLAGGTGAEATNDYTRSDTVTVAAGAQIYGAGSIQLSAGRDAQGNDALLDYDTYTHAYSKALIPGADSKLIDSFSTTDRVTIEGDVTAVKNVSVAGTRGTVNTKESARYYTWTSHSDAGKVRIASTHLGEQSESFTGVEEIRVNGSVTAGTNTSAEVTISGIVVPEGFSVEGASYSTRPTIETQGAVRQENVTTGTENLANVYYERYMALKNIIESYSGKAPSEETRAIVLAYQAELDRLQSTMLQKGYAEWADAERTKLVLIVDTNGKHSSSYVKVSNLSVSGGSIDLTAGNVKGSGRIIANAADQIKITNNSTLALKVEDVRILEKGGELTLNGTSVSEISGFDGEVTSHLTENDPTLTIASSYSGSPLTVKKTVDGTEYKKEGVKPDTSIEILGTVENAAGNVSVTSGNDISVPFSTDVNRPNRLVASGSLQLSAQGSVMQSYKAGVTNIGAAPETLWADKVRSAHETLQGAASGTTVSDSTMLTDSSSMIVAGSDIYISGDLINLNGLVQSGYASYGINLGSEATETRIAEIKRTWAAAGSPTDINPRGSAYVLTKAGSYKTTDGNYAYQSASWYDPVSDRILIEDITPTGGHIYLTGGIANTGGGQIVAVDGAATVSIAAGLHNVTLGAIHTGSVNGSVTITDTNYSKAEFTGEHGTYSKDYSAKVTTYEDGKTTVRWLTLDGQYEVPKLLREEPSDGTETAWIGVIGADPTCPNGVITEGYSVYKPLENLYYSWSTGEGTVTYNKIHKVHEFKLWGAWDWDNWTDVTQTQERKDLSELGSEKTISVMQDVGDGAFVGKVEVTNLSTSERRINRWTDYDDCFHFAGWHNEDETWTESATRVYTYSVKADQEIRVNRVSGSNTISVTTGGSLMLTDDLTAQNGTVTLSATKGISAGNSDVSIRGASTVNLSATEGSVGTKSEAIRVANSSGLVLSATASGLINIDASNLAEGAAVSASDICSTKGDVTVAARGNLAVSSLQGRSIRLTSREGDISVVSLQQVMDADLNAGERFDASALSGSVTITNGTGDLYVGRIEAKEAVSVTTSGALYDALDRSDLDNGTTEERLQSWIDAGLLKRNGEEVVTVNRYAEDLANAENAVKNDFARYQAYIANEEKTSENKSKQTLSAAQQSDYDTLKDRFDGCANAAAAIEKEKATKGTTLYTVVAGSGNYGWTANELLYAVADSVINPKGSASTSPDAESTNISAKVVTITTGTGIGQDLATETKQVSAIDTDFLKKLARAESGDLKIALNTNAAEDTITDYTLTLNLKRSVSVHLTDKGETDSSVSALATAGNIYIESASEDALRVKEVKGLANVTLSGAKGIMNATSATGITGKNIVLNGHLGSIGTEESALCVNQSSDGWTQLTAAGLVNVASPQTLTIYSANSGAAMNISADKIRAWQDESDVSSLLGYIKAEGTITLTSNGVGEQDTDLTDAVFKMIRVDGSSNVVLKTLKEDKPFDGVYLLGVGAGTLTVTAEDSSPLKPQSVVLRALGELDSEGRLTQAGDLVVLGSWESGDFSAIAAGDLTAQSSSTTSTSIKTTMGNLVLTANNVYASGLEAESAGDLTVSAKEVANLEKAVLKLNGGDAVLKAETGTLNIKNIKVSGTVDDMTVIAGKEDVDFGDAGSLATMTGALNVTAAAGKVNAVGKTLKAKSVSISGKTGLTADNANIVSTDAGISLVASNGALSATGLTAEAKTTLTVSAASDVTLTSAEIKSTGKTEVSSTSGAVSADNLTASTVGGLSITGDKSVSAKNASVNSTDGVMVKATAGNVDVSGNNEISAANGVEISASGSVTATNKTIEAGAVSIEAGSGANAAGGNITATEGGITISSTQSDIDLSKGETTESSLTACNGAVSVTAQSGVVNAAGKTISAGSVAVQAAGNADISRVTITTTADDGASVTAGGSLAMTNLNVNDTAKLTLSAGQGNVDLNKAQIGKVSGALSVTATNGDILATDKTITVGTASLTAGGNLVANNLKLKVDSTDGGAVTLKATNGDSHLENASITGSVTALTIEGGKSLDLSGAATGDATEGTGSKLTAETVTLKTNGKLDLGSTGATVKATSGDLTINAGTLTLGQSSELTAAGELDATVTDKLEAKDGFCATGSSVSITGGNEEFKIASGSSFTSTNGGIDLIASSNLKLGGSLRTSATSQDSSSAAIRIGTEGILSVEDSGATISATSGSVAVVGKKGMDIKHNLTVLSSNTVALYSEQGPITIGNSATVVAGSGPEAIADQQYGDVVVEAGKDISIGDYARLLSDNLTVTADNNVTFGTNATLVGMTDGVAVNATKGSITMGENLTVLSNASTTNFNAGLDIVVDKAGELYSRENNVNLRAQRDVIIGDKFVVYSKKFTMMGVRDVTVDDNASVVTDFTQTTDGNPYSTAIVAGRNVTFGDSAKFLTTDVNIVAGLVEKEGGSVGDIEGFAYSGEKGCLAFGKKAEMVTTHRGIEVLAVGDITFDDGASFVTAGDFTATTTNPYAIDFYSEQGDIRLGSDATIATRKSAPIYVRAASGSVTLGDRAGIGDFNEDTEQVAHTSTAKIEGASAVTFGRKAFVWSGEVLVKSESGSITTGDDSFFVGVKGINFEALKTMTFDGNILLASDKLVNVQSSAGDILMNITSSEVFAEGRVENAVFTAAGSVIQTGPLGARGIAADTLTIQAGKDVLLGIVSTPADATSHSGTGSVATNNGGNTAGRVVVTAGGDVALTLSSDDARVAVNTASGGMVNGRLSVKSDGGSVTFEHEQSAQSIGVYAGRISAGALAATNELELATAPYDIEGVSLSTGKLTGGSVAIRLGKGVISVPSVTATSGDVSVVRLSGSAADVVVPTLSAARDVILMNAGGRITGEDATIGNRAYIIGATKLRETGFSQFASGKDTVYLAGAGSLAQRWNVEWIRGLSAVDLKAGMLSVTLVTDPELINIIRTTDRASIDPAKRRSDEGLRFMHNQLRMSGPADLPSALEHRVTDYWTDAQTKLLQREKKPTGVNVVPLVLGQVDGVDLAF